MFLWVAGVSIISQAFFWTTEQLLVISGLTWPGWAWLVIALIQGVALILPNALVVVLWPRGRLRPIALTLSLGGAYVLLMAPMRLVQSPSIILANVLQIVLTTLAIVVVLLVQGTLGRYYGRPRSGSSLWLALLLATWAAYPWLMWGAFGSPLDTALNLIASLLFGVLAGLLMSWFLYRPLMASGPASTRGLLWAGIASVALLIEMASAFGFGGLQLLLLIVVPSFGVVAAALYRVSGQRVARRQGAAVAILIGLVTAAPGMLVDPDEMALVLAVGSRDLLQWALYAAFVSSTLGWALGIALIVFRSRVRGLGNHPVLRIAVLLSLLLGAVLYFTIGQPGFHGDQLFIILKNRAEVAAAAEIDDLDARREYVYRSLVEHANSTQDELTSILDRFGIDYQSYYLVNGLRVDAGPLVELWLANRPEVDRILHNPVLRPLRAPPQVARGSAERPTDPPWNLRLIGADRVWQDFGITGEGIIIGQSDSGVDGLHPELAGAYRGRSAGDDRNWYDPWDGSSKPVDIGGHGTHTLATIVGATTGVAPGADWIGCVNLERNLASPSLYLDCLQFMLAPFPQGGDPLLDGDPSLAADVLNNSWGCPPVEGCDPDALLDAAHALRAAGIFVVASAGNEGPFCETVRYPMAHYDEVLSVGAVDKGGSLAFFSSIGPVTVDGSQRVKPDILAPGVSVLSAFPGGTYQFLDGTSMAGPHLAGVIALMWSANPSLKGEVVRTEQILLQAANEYQGEIPTCGDQLTPPHNGTGYGIVDAYAVVQAALERGD